MQNEILANLYNQIETDLLQNIACWFAKNQDLKATTPQWKMKMLANLGKLDKENLKIIKSYVGDITDEMALALETAALEVADEFEPAFSSLVKNGLVTGKNYAVSDLANKSMGAYLGQAKDSLNLVNSVMKYKSKDVARDMINNAAELANKQDFLDSLNKATGKVVSGAEARSTALRQCVSEMSKKGIPAFVDKMGRNWSPEAYVNMTVRTTSQNVKRKMEFDYMDEYDVDLIEISSHSGARPKCEKAQGKIFSRSGKSKKYPAFSSTSVGQPDGLFGINCRHRGYPFIEGVNTQTFFPIDKEENDTVFKLSQRQRSLECDIRHSKNECMMLKELDDDVGYKAAAIRLKNRRDKLKTFCNKNGLRQQPEREYVGGFGRSEASSASYSARKQKNVDKLNG